MAHAVIPVLRGWRHEDSTLCPATEWTQSQSGLYGILPQNNNRPSSLQFARSSFVPEMARHMCWSQDKQERVLTLQGAPMLDLQSLPSSTRNSGHSSLQFCKEKNMNALLGKCTYIMKSAGYFYFFFFSFLLFIFLISLCVWIGDFAYKCSAKGDQKRILDILELQCQLSDLGSFANTIHTPHCKAISQGTTQGLTCPGTHHVDWAGLL